MHAALEHLYHELTGVRTGRASTAMLDTVSVEVYGERQALAHVGTVLMRGPRTLAVTVYDVGNIGPVMEAIRLSPLQLDPRLERGEVVVPVPECALAHLLQLRHVLAVWAVPRMQNPDGSTRFMAT